MEEKKEEKDKRFKKKLMDLLKDDDDIRGIIYSICDSNSNLPRCEEENEKFITLKDSLQKLKEEKESLTKENKNLRDEIQEKDSNIEKLNAKIRQISDELHSIQTKAQKVRKEYESEMQKNAEWQENYGDIDRMYKLYMSLEEKVYKDLERVLNPEGQICQNAETFFSYGVQEDNIFALWNVMSMKHQEYESLHVLDKLKQLFCYFINNYNNISTKECTLYFPLVGEEYDEREQNRTSDGNVSGTIEEVILPGFSIGKNIHKKPLVRVK